MSQQHIATFLRQTANKQRISLTELAQRAKISRNGLIKLLNGEVHSPSLESLTNLAFALNTSPHHLFSLWLIDVPIPRHSSRIDDSHFVADITYQDGEFVRTGATFVKQWAIANRGQRAWSNRWITCQDDQHGLYRRDGDNFIKLEYTLSPVSRKIPIPLTHPGQTAIIEMTFTAPDTPAYVISHWKMTDMEGNLCFPEMEGLRCCVNVVQL